MENAEEIMQLLEEFSKTKPKEIPRELEEYLGYVAKSGDPVFQWSLVKHLFREKLISVITDFYESTLTVDLPPCPNVDPFSYERMKSSLLERFDSFSSAPFTIQRICELLTNPRKEYNRADKYMRAIEKNILVVSTREPGSGKRSLECDSQAETVLNGMPDVKINETDGHLLHVPTELPYLGAPPASNDVTIETTETNTPIDRCALDVNGEVKKFKTEGSSEKSWVTQETPSVSEQFRSSVPKLEIEDGISVNVEDKSSAENNDRLDSGSGLSTEQFSSDNSSETFEHSKSINIPDSIDSAPECTDDIQEAKLVNEEVVKENDENEVSSTPADTSEVNIALVQEIEEPTDSEAEATNSSPVHSIETADEVLSGSKIISTNELIETSDDSVTITQITGNQSNEVDLKCNEITGTMDSPASPDDISSQIDQSHEFVVDVAEQNEDPELHPDSSNDICQHCYSPPSEKDNLGSGSEADSLTEENNVVSTENHKSEDSSDHINSSDIVSTATDNDHSKDTGKCEKPNLTTGDAVFIEKTLLEDVCSSESPEDSSVSEGQCSFVMSEESIKLLNVENSSENNEDISDPERREGSIIQAVSDVSPDSQVQVTPVEEISVDPSCEADEEAMEVDDSSNQMMVSEGENEGEPMEQCDQLQS